MREIQMICLDRITISHLDFLISKTKDYTNKSPTKKNEHDNYYRYKRYIMTFL
jgi:hypothetical protein